MILGFCSSGCLVSESVLTLTVSDSAAHAVERLGLQRISLPGPCLHCHQEPVPAVKGLLGTKCDTEQVWLSTARARVPKSSSEQRATAALCTRSSIVICIQASVRTHVGLA